MIARVEGQDSRTPLTLFFKPDSARQLPQSFNLRHASTRYPTIGFQVPSTASLRYSSFGSETRAVSLHAGENVFLSRLMADG